VKTAWIIAEKTFLRNILDLRFLVASALVLVLMLISGSLMSREMDERLRSDFERRTLAVRNLEQVTVVKSPSPLAFVADGGEGELPWSATVRPEYVDTAGLGLPRRSFIESFPLLDWAFLVVVVLSLMALFFSYDLVAGEKESRVLPCQLSHPIRRSDVLFGGYLGTLLSFCPLLVAGILGNLLIVSTTGTVPLTLDHLARITLVVTLALAFVSSFVLLGLLMSTCFHQSASSLMSGVIIWTLLVIIIPQGGGPLAAVLVRVPTDQQLQREIGNIVGQLGSFSIGSEMIRDIVVGPGSREQKQQRINELAATLETRYQEQQQKMQQQIGKVVQEYSRQRDRQVLLAQRIARLSPAALFQVAATELCHTGLSHHWSFLENAERYRLRFADYSRVTKEASKNKAKPTSHGSASMDGFTISVVFTRDYSDVPVNAATFPAFGDSWPSLSKSLGRALFDIGLLALTNVVLFLTALVRFLRYDVR
jgi:ABC-type transport system involved in multi-copper enzyme maturation permease subunit